MSRPRLLLNAFTMNTATHVSYGTWRREDARQTEFHTLEPWLELARILERGGFDSVFFADVVGLYDDFDGGWDTHVTEGLQIPNHDPSALVSALASVTEHLGIVIPVRCCRTTRSRSRARSARWITSRAGGSGGTWSPARCATPRAISTCPTGWNTTQEADGLGLPAGFASGAPVARGVQRGGGGDRALSVHDYGVRA
ncbi:LLM class oxidoreductase [Nocardia puris]|uniref:Luciferase-like monooxygenase n=1 Tax=Nocardia puris TaxID=208602 RepID=A0A366E204_9NOCA|nr:luciferase-like monooxygenase [Nocardia puris]